MSDLNAGRFHAALLNAKAKFAPVHKDAKNPHLNNRYATLDAVLEAVEKPLNDEGFVIVQTPVPTEQGWALQTRILFETGEELAGMVPLVFGGTGERINPMQGLGSAISYARRYGLMGLLSLTAEDDDGHGAGYPPQARQQQPQRREERPQRAQNGHAEAIDPARPPRDGKMLYAVLKGQEDAGRKGLIKRVNGWMAEVGFDKDTKITQLGGKDVAEVWPVVMEALGIDMDLPVETN